MDKLVTWLDSIEEKVLKEARQGIAETTLIIHSAAVANAPVDEGFLKKSIEFKFENGGLLGVVTVGADYAIYVEYGTGVFATGPGGSRAKKIPWHYQDEKGWHTTKGQPPQPYWRPALKQGKSYFKNYFG